jgi:hypothetical protein
LVAMWDGISFYLDTAGCVKRYRDVRTRGRNTGIDWQIKHSWSLIPILVGRFGINGIIR